MDRQDRLAAELRGWYGVDYDNYYSVNDIDQVPKEFLIHDTTFSNSVRVCEEGSLKSKQANDTAYDGHLAWGEAPAVVSFQASDCGENRSMYPRGFTGQKGRFLVPPQQLGIHTDAFHMYFVQITESRRAKAEATQPCCSCTCSSCQRSMRSAPFATSTSSWSTSTRSSRSTTTQKSGSGWVLRTERASRTRAAWRGE